MWTGNERCYWLEPTGVPSPKSLGLRGVQNGPPARRSRKVGHSFEGLIDSHLGVIADSTDNGVDLRLWPNAEMILNLIVNAVEATRAVSNRALALLIRTEEQSSDNLEDKESKREFQRADCVRR